MDTEYAVNQVYLKDRTYEASDQLAELKRRLSLRGIETKTRISTGIPSQEVIAAAQAEEADLVIVGTRGKSGLAHGGRWGWFVLYCVVVERCTYQLVERVVISILLETQ